MRSDPVPVQLLVTAGLALAFCLTLAAAQRNHSHPRAVVAPDQITEKTFTLGAAPQLTIDNVDGPIHLVGDGGSEVRLEAREQLSADTAADLAQGEKDVHLDITQTGDALKLYVDGPFRCNNDSVPCGWASPDGRRHWSDPGYQASFTFELHVPAATMATLSTVNGGDINVEKLAGDFDIHNVNGGIALAGLSGSGHAATINGPLQAAFRSNPARDSGFRSLNGKLELYFQAPFNANLLYKTFNGQVYSDFAVLPLPGVAPTSETRDGMRVFSNGKFTSGRAGRGGPEITLDGFNGNIYIHQVK